MKRTLMASYATSCTQKLFAFPPPMVPSVRIAPQGQTKTSTRTTVPHGKEQDDDGGCYFPVHRIYCVGRNYAEHAREMGGYPEREPPFFFTKPPDAIVDCQRLSFLSEKQQQQQPPASLLLPPNVPYPLATRDFHHEIELVVAIGEGGTHIRTEQALDHVFGYAVGVDLTRRDLQAEAKKHGRPWDSAKAFDQSAPISWILPVNRIEKSHSDAASADSIHNALIWLNVNGERRQTGYIHQMTWSIPEIISSLSHQFHLAAGDLIFTGTPSGVGPLERGDLVEGGVDGVGQIQFRVE